MLSGLIDSGDCLHNETKLQSGIQIQIIYSLTDGNNVKTLVKS